jgi:SnoaL-like polyketide cyclase
VPEQIKPMVRRLVESINAGGEAGAVEELFAPRATRRAKRLFGEFRRAFPDWREEVVALVAEGDTVAGRFRCSGPHVGEFFGEAPTGKRMEVEGVFFLRVEAGSSWTTGLLRTVWAGCASPAFSRHEAAGRVEPRRASRAYRTYSAEDGIGPAID